MRKIIMVLTCLVLVPVYGFSAVLSWDPLPPAKTYSVYVREAGQKESDYRLVQSGVSGLSITVIPEVRTKSYEYAVKAVNECGVSGDFSEPVVFNECMSEVMKKVTGIKITFEISTK